MPELIDLSDIGASISPDSPDQPTKNPLDLSDLGAKPAGSGIEAPTVEEFGGGEFGRGIARGHLVATAGFANFARLFGDTEGGKLKDIADRALEEASMIPTKAGSIKDVLKDPTLAPAYVTRVVGELAPQAVLAYLTGGTGAAVGRGLGLGATGVRTATGVGAAASSIPQEVGHIYQETGSPSAALAYGIPAGALDALSAERIIGKVFRTTGESAQRKAWRQVVRDAVKDVPKSAGIESVTEATQESLALLANKSADETYDLLTQDNGWRVLEAAVAGAIGGGVLGGGMGLVRLPAEGAARQQRADTIRVQRQIRNALREVEQEQTPVARPEPSETELEYAGGEMPQVPGFPEPPARIPRPAPNVPVQAIIPEPKANLVPVLETSDGKTYPGLSHAQALSTAVQSLQSGEITPEELNAVMEAHAVDAQHKFLNVDTGQVLNRTEAGQLIGINAPLDSQNLPDQQKEKSLPEAQLLSVMTPEERQDYLQRKTPNVQRPQADPVPVQAPGPVVEEEQTQSVPPIVEAVRPAQAPAQQIQSTGIVELTDLASLPTAGDLTKYKTPTEVVFDPLKGTPGKARVVIALNPNARGKSAGQLQIQTEDGRTIWSAKISDLQQAGVLSGNRINLDQLWTSPLLTKNTDRRFAAYKLPTEQLQRSQGATVEQVLDEADKISPFFGAVLASLNPTMQQIEGMAGARTGGAEYAGKTAERLADQVHKFLLRALESNVIDKSKNMADLSEDQLIALGVESRARKALKSKATKLDNEDVQAAASQISTLPELQSVGQVEGEVSIEAVSGSRFGGDEGGEAPDTNPIGATWDPARTNTIIGQIEDRDPKLYQSFDADPENDAAWEKIEEALVKFLDGDKVGAEILAEAIRQRRMEGWMALPGRGIQIANDATDEVNWLTGISATGKDGIASLLNNRRIQLDPKLRRIGLALVNRIPAKYLEHLTFNIDKTGAPGGEFIPWMKTAQIAMNSTDPTVAAHEISHYLAQFLTSKERGEVAAARASEIALTRTDQSNRAFFDWLDSQGGSATSAAYKQWRDDVDIDPRTIASLGTPFRFATSTEIALRTAKPFGIQPDKNGFIPKSSLLSKMKNQVSKDELLALKPILDSLPDRVNAQMLANRIQEQGPQLEVVKLDAHKGVSRVPVSPVVLEHDNLEELQYQLAHELETIGVTPREIFVLKDGTGGFKFSIRSRPTVVMALTNPAHAKDSLHKEVSNAAELIQKYWDTTKRLTEIDEQYQIDIDRAEASEDSRTDSATFNYQFVNPKPLKDMPGAVDILVRIPRKVVRPGAVSSFEKYEHEKFKGGHFGGSDVNVVGWVRAYIETLGSGERVFHVFEVQSDWAQGMRSNLEMQRQAIARGEPNPRGDAAMERAFATGQYDNLLHYYESAALKAAIRHAHELGITKVAISDAETAMITEGHDRAAEFPAENVMAQTIGQWGVRFPDGTRSWMRNREVAVQNQGWHGGELIQATAKDIGPKVIRQEPGMRLHYDTTLPNIMRKLTGKAPVVVDFGVHQNVTEQVPRETREGVDPNLPGNFVRTVYDTKLRKDLLFGGKTSITARVFDISSINTDIPAQMYRSSLYSVTDPLYHLINDDEYFAHYMSEASANAPAQIEGLFGKVRDIIRRIFEAMKEWVGIHPTYWEQLIRKFERGEFLVHENGGMLFEQNNRTGAKSLPPIKGLPSLRRYTGVDQGQEESALIRTLGHEQNQPLVGHVGDLFRLLPRSVRAELPGIASRLAALMEVNRQGGPVGETPLKHYATLVNALAIKEEGRTLSAEIEQILQEIQKQNKRGDKASQAEALARQLEDMAKNAIADYKNFLISEQRKSRNDGVAQGLSEAIKTLDSLKHSTESLKRAIDFIAETVTLEQLNDPSMSTQQVVDIFKKRITELTGASTWQEATIPPGGNRPGVSNEQLRIAVVILQNNQNLVQELITYKELSDPDFARIMKEGQPEFDKQIASLTYRELRSFLKSYHSIRSAKDRARSVYIKHRARLKDLIDRLDVKSQAEEFLATQVVNSVQFRNAMAEAAEKGFWSADLIRDNSGNDVLKRTYLNPLNREETVDIVDGSTKADYDRNIEAYDKVATWYEDALADEGLAPLDKQRILFELSRIYNQELGYDRESPGVASFDPVTGKRAPGPLNVSNILANLTGNSLQFAMQKIGGRAAVQVSAIFQARSEARRRVAEVRHEMQFAMQRAILEAMNGHTTTQERWVKEVAEPILASFNSVGSKQIKAGDITRYGHRVNGKDMEAVRAMKKFIDAIASASKDMELHTSRLHPIKIKEVVGGVEILRDQQGGTELIVPRRFNRTFLELLNRWSRIKNNRKATDAAPDLMAYVQSGVPFQGIVVPHIYSTQRYPDYANPTRFKNAYREIYGNILEGNVPTSFNQVVDIVFDSQTGNNQLTKEEIAREIIVKELDSMVNKVLDQRSKDRAGDTPGMQVRVESADNFLTRPRGEMIAPDSGYQYSVVTKKDIQWLSSSVLEVHEQMARDGLEKVQKMLEEYVTEWQDRVKHPDPQKESLERQISGEDWLNYREAKQMLNQVRRHLDQTSPDAFRAFIDEQFGSTGRRIWSILIQSLLQSATVLKNNLLGMNLRLWQMEQQWRGDGLWMGMPRWLLKLPTMAKNGIAWPMRDLPAYIMSGVSYRKGLKGVRVTHKGKELTGEEALREILHDRALYETAAAQVGGYTLKRAVDVQRARDLGAAGDYGLRDQMSRYIVMHNYGGEFEHLDQSTPEKIKGSLNSILGLFQETGGGVMLPKALAPRKLEQYLNFQAIRHADRLLADLTLNIKEAIRDRQELGKSQRITDQELLGDQSAKTGDAQYMRKMFDRANLNLDALMQRLSNNPQDDLLTPAEWNSFVLEVAKELNMPAADNRVSYKSGFARLMSSLMGYGMWYNERLAETMARDSGKRFDLAAVYRTLFFVGAIASMGIFLGTPLQRLLKRLFYDEEDQTGRFSEDNTAWRNAGVLWEQTTPFWPIIGSVMSQLYDARTGGGKLFNFLPVSVAAQALQSANEVGQTGNVFYPTIKLMRLWLPNTKIILNRIPQMEGAMEVSGAARILRSTAAGDIEVRAYKSGGGVKYSPVSTQVQLAVNEMARDNPDYESIKHYRNDAVKTLMKRGASRQDAERRFDLAVLARYPENTVYGRPLTDSERAAQQARMTTDQISRLSQVENSFDRYATTFGLRAPSQRRQSKSNTGSSVRLSSVRGLSGRGRRRRRNRLVRNRSLTGRRNRRRLVRI